MSTFITKSFLGHSTSKNHRHFSPAAGFYWLIKLSVLPLTPSSKVPKKLPDVNLYYQIVSKPFYEQISSKFFACGGHLLAHKTTNSALNFQFQSPLIKLPQMLTFITKSFLSHSTSKYHKNFSPAAGIYWLIKIPVLPLTPSFKKKLPQMSTFITKSFLGHSTSTNHRNFSPVAKSPK